MPRRLKILLALLGLLCVVAIVNYAEVCIKPITPRFAIGGHSYAGEHEEESEAKAAKRKASPQKGAPPLPAEFQKPVIKMGAPNAPVKIKAYLLEIQGCHRPTLEALRAVARKFPKRVYVEIVNMETPKGQELASKEGVHCVSVFINGRKSFKLPAPGGKRRTVVLSGMVGASFLPEDIEAIVRMELSKGKESGAESGAPGGAGRG